MKAPFIKLFVKDFAFDISGMTDAEVGRIMKAFIEAYKSGNIPESFAKYSIFSALTLANANYSTTCERNKQNRVKSMGCNNQSSTTGQPLVNQSSTTLVNQNQNQNQNQNIEEEKNQTEAKKAIGLFENQTEAKKAVNVNVNVNDKEDIMFDSFWKKYIPVVTKDGKSINKGSRKEAREKFFKVLKRGISIEKLNLGLDRYLSDCIANNRLTCGVCVWLNEERWDNEYGNDSHTPTPTLTDAERFDLWVSDYKRFGIWDKPLPRPDSDMARGKYTTEQAAIARKHGYLNEVLI